MKCGAEVGDLGVVGAGLFSLAEFFDGLCLFAGSVVKQRQVVRCPRCLGFRFTADSSDLSASTGWWFSEYARPSLKRYSASPGSKAQAFKSSSIAPGAVVVLCSGRPREFRKTQPSVNPTRWLCGKAKPPCSTCPRDCWKRPCCIRPDGWSAVCAKNVSRSFAASVRVSTFWRSAQAARMRTARVGSSSNLDIARRVGAWSAWASGSRARTAFSRASGSASCDN